MITIENLSFQYGKKAALTKVNAVFETGKLYAVVGPNGCGKTTLIRLMAGLLHPNSGAVCLDGKRAETFSRMAYARKVAWMPQERTIPRVSVEEYVTNARYPYLNLSRSLTEKDRQAVETALRQTGTEAFRHRRMTELSGGERQRVYLAMLLAQDTTHVLLDEPTTYLDVGYQFSVMQQLMAMRDAGKCVIAVLHDLSLAFQYCDEVLVLHKGKVYGFDKPENIVGQELIPSVFGVQCKKIEKSYLFYEK